LAQKENISYTVGFNQSEQEITVIIIAAANGDDNAD